MARSLTPPVLTVISQAVKLVDEALATCEEAFAALEASFGLTTMQQLVERRG